MNARCPLCCSELSYRGWALDVQAYSCTRHGLFVRRADGRLVQPEGFEIYLSLLRSDRTTEAAPGDPGADDSHVRRT
jgi:hypothetical protein